MKRLATAILIGALAISAGCSSSPAGAPAATSLPSGIDAAGMDTSVAPGDDFNAYANGGWLKATPIPADKSSYGAGTILADQTRQQTVALIQDPAKAGPGATPRRPEGRATSTRASWTRPASRRRASRR